MTINEGLETDVGTSDFSPRTKTILQFLQATLPSLVAILAGMWGLVKYPEAQEAAAQKVQAELLQEQVHVYIDTLNTAATLEESDQFGSSDWNNSLRHFRELNFVLMPLVQDKNVEKPLSEFAKELFEDSRKPQPLSESDRDALRHKAGALIRELRSSIENHKLY